MIQILSGFNLHYNVAADREKIVKETLEEYYLLQELTPKEAKGFIEDVIVLIEYCRSHYMINPTLTKIENVAHYYSYLYDKDILIAVKSAMSRLEKHFEVAHE